MDNMLYLKNSYQYFNFLNSMVDLDSYKNFIEEAKCFDFSFTKEIFYRSHFGEPIFINDKSYIFISLCPPNDRFFWYNDFSTNCTGKLFLDFSNNLQLISFTITEKNIDKDKYIIIREPVFKINRSTKYQDLLLVKGQSDVAVSLAKANCDTVFGDVIYSNNREDLEFYKYLYYDILKKEYENTNYDIKYHLKENGDISYILIYKKDKNYERIRKR